MTLTDLFMTQLSDVFRIGLMIALIATTVRTEGATGLVLPLAAGVVFIAVLIPLTMSPPQGTGLAEAIGSGIAANAVILAVLLVLRAVFLRFRG